MVNSTDLREPVVLAIVGSTMFAFGSPAEAEARRLIEAAIDRLRPVKVVSGGATGVDRLAIEVARSRGIPVQEYLPRHRRWAPDGFAARNLLIAQSCTHLLRVAHERSTTYGSGWTADRAEALGKVVERHTVKTDGQ